MESQRISEQQKLILFRLQTPRNPQILPAPLHMPSFICCTGRAFTNRPNFACTAQCKVLKVALHRVRPTQKYVLFAAGIGHLLFRHIRTAGTEDVSYLYYDEVHYEERLAKCLLKGLLFGYSSYLVCTETWFLVV